MQSLRQIHAVSLRCIARSLHARQHVACGPAFLGRLEPQPLQSRAAPLSLHVWRGSRAPYATRSSTGTSKKEAPLLDKLRNQSSTTDNAGNQPVGLIQYESLNTLRLFASQYLSHVHLTVPIVHVAGSNGKGSTCAMLSAIFTHAGFKTGLFVSPPLIHDRDSILINGKPISAEQWSAAKLHLDGKYAEFRAAHPTLSISSFEYLTCLVLLVFRNEAVDLAVLECGMGGLMDATNICEKKLGTAITSISLEHQEYLGSKLTTIAAHKAGIVQKGVPLTLSSLIPESIVSSIFKQNCNTSPTIIAKPAERIPGRPGWCRDLSTGAEFRMPFEGEVQLQNAATAISVVRQIRLTRPKFRVLTNQAIAEGIAKAVLRGRLEWQRWPRLVSGATDKDLLLVDGAHNPEAVAHLRDHVHDILAQRQQARPNKPNKPKSPAQSVVWIMAATKTKDVEGMARILFAHLPPSLRDLRQSVFCVPFDPVSSMPWVESNDPQVLAARVKQAVMPDEGSARDALSPTVHVESFQSLAQALRAAHAMVTAAGSGGSAPLVVVCGSLYLVRSFFRLQLSGVQDEGEIASIQDEALVDRE